MSMAWTNFDLTCPSMRPHSNTMSLATGMTKYSYSPQKITAANNDSVVCKRKLVKGLFGNPRYLCLFGHFGSNFCPFLTLFSVFFLPFFSGPFSRLSKKDPKNSPQILFHGTKNLIKQHHFFEK